MIPVPETLTEGTDTHRLFLALRSGQPKSHHELYGLSMIVHSRASDLRLKHGCLIDTWRDGKTTWYQLRAVRENGNATTDGLAVSDRSPGQPSTAVPPAPPESAGASWAGPASPSTVGPAQQLSVFEAA